MKTVLIIEDNEQNLYLARFILEKGGLRVEAAMNGPDGIAAALRLKPDLILLDIQLPGMDGHQVAEKLRSLAVLSTTPILAVTSFAMAGDRDRILQAGCTGYLEKPIDPATFLGEVERILNSATATEGTPEILVVDDGEQNQEMLATLFGSCSWIVRTAADGQQALASARNRPPTLVISDILMPVMDGFALCREWRRDPVLAAIPFIFYTATYTDPEDEHFGLSLGANRFLVKPLEPELLIAEVQTLLKSQGKEAGLAQPIQGTADEKTQLRAYNAALIRKLEDKMNQLELANTELEKRVKERTSQLEAANLELQAVSQVGTWTSQREASQLLTWSAETCRIFGLKPESFDGRLETFLSFISPEDRASHEAAMAKAWINSEPLDNILRIRPEGGGLRWVHIQGRLASEVPNQPRRMVGIVRDITEQRLLQQQLWEAQKLEAVGQLAGGIAHDFNNLMTIVQANTGVLLAESGLSTSANQHLEEILGASQRACDLSRRLLAFSRRQVLVLKAIDFNQVVDGMVTMLKRVVGNHILVRQELHPNLPPAMADTGMMEQVIMNLIVNARDAMPAGGELTLKTGVCTRPIKPGPSGPAGEGFKTFIQLSVSDTGSGISSKHLPHIFEPFFTTKPPGKGSGLGLATVYGILQQHGGSIEVESSEGAGTTFHISIPTTDRAVEKPVLEAMREIPKGTETLLIVEDEPSIRLAIRTILGNLGYNLIEAAGTQDALRCWSECGDQVDLLLTDILLPGELSGYQLAEELRKSHPRLKVILTSGHSFNLDTQRPGISNALFLPKPFGLEQLALTVRKALES